MTIEILLVLLVVLLALLLFMSEKYPVDITAFLLLVLMMGLGLVFPDSFPSVKEGLSGLSSTATMTVLAMFILSAGVQKTGVIHRLSRVMFRWVGNSELRQLSALGLIVAPISGFINNTAAVAIMLPMVLDLAKRSGTAATKLLIPLSFFGMLGGTLTLIGTSTNILAAAIVKDSIGLEIGMFEFTKLGAIVLLVGTLYFLLVGRFLLPDRRSGEAMIEDDLFLTEVVIEKKSPLLGKSLREAEFASKNDVKVLKLVRADKSYIKDCERKELEEGDILLLQTGEQQIIDLQAGGIVRVLPNFNEQTRRRRAGTPGKIIKIMLREAQVFHRKTLEQIDFWQRFGVMTMGVNLSETDTLRLATAPLRVGEILLVQGSQSALKKLYSNDKVMVLEEVEDEFDSSKLWTALGIVIAVVVVAAVTPVPIVVSALGGVMAMFLTNCLEKDEIYTSVSWDVIFLLAGVIPLGIAMNKSGAAALIAEQISDIAIYFPPILLLMLIYLVTTLMTEIVSNNASVAILIPIVLSVAVELGYAPLPLILTVMFAASTSFLTPVGYQTNTMVYASGNYKFSDFLRVGGLLNLILLVITCSLINHFWPLV